MDQNHSFSPRPFSAPRSTWGFIAASFVACACATTEQPNQPGDTGGSTSTGGQAGLVGGSTSTGGSPTGGSTVTTGGAFSTGGSATGGANAAGGAPTGGSAAGGANAGGTATGGKATGGANTGGANTGGANAGGTATGGKATGGAITGGAPSGGNATTGGKATGGVPTGGTATGGTPTGGTATGGKATGGAATGGTGAGGCSNPPAPSTLVGWAAVSGNSVSTTTGGGNATPVVVTTLSALNTQAGGSTAAVIYVQGPVTISGKITIGSNKTIVGTCGAELHGHIEMSGSTNVIVRNIKISGYGVGDCSLDPNYDSTVGCSSGQDAISLQKNSHHVWFDHCDISDGTDGNLDITNGANYVTVSWTKFHYTPRSDNNGSDSTGAAGHRYSNLVGGTDSPSGYDDANALNVTWHHNWWADNVMERQPRVRFGKNHIFNNLYSAAGNNYCVRAGIQAQILIENNAFTGVKSPHVFNSTTDQGTAYITANGNAYTNTSGTQATGGGGTPFTTPPYSYTADAASGVQAAVQSGAGPH
jgi:pectate lyase